MRVSCLLQWCSPFAALQLPNTSTPCGLLEKHTRNTFSSVTHAFLLSVSSYSHKLSVGCWRNRVVSSSLQLKSRDTTHISSRLHESFLSWRNKGNFAPFWLKHHLRLCSHFGLAFRIWYTFSLDQLNRASFLMHLTRALLHNSSVHHPESDSCATVLISGVPSGGGGAWTSSLQTHLCRLLSSQDCSYASLSRFLKHFRVIFLQIVSLQ